MFIEITRGKLVIEATNEEWKGIRHYLNLGATHTIEKDRAGDELNFAVLTLLRQESA